MAIVIATAIVIEIVIAIDILAVAMMVEIEIATIGAEENMNEAVCFIGRAHTSPQITVTIDMALTRTTRVTGTAYTRARTMRGEVRLTIRSARIFTSTAPADFSRSSAARLPMAWLIATGSCAVTKRATKTIRITLSADDFIDSSICLDSFGPSA